MHLSKLHSVNSYCSPFTVYWRLLNCVCCHGHHSNHNQSPSNLENTLYQNHQVLTFHARSLCIRRIMLFYERENLSIYQFVTTMIRFYCSILELQLYIEDLIVYYNKNLFVHKNLGIFIPHDAHIRIFIQRDAHIRIFMPRDQVQTVQEVVEKSLPL